MGKKKQDAKAADDDAVLLAAQRRPPSLALVAAALVACCGVAFEVGRRSAACEACAACPEPVAAAPSDPKSCPPCPKEKKKGRKEKAPRAWVTDDEAISLELCSSQDDNHRCAPALADGVPDALTDGATFNKFARAGVPWVARNTTLAGPRDLRSWLDGVGPLAPVRASTLPDNAYGVGYLGELVAGAGETPFYAPQIPCAAAPAMERHLGIAAAARQVLGSKTDACNVWFGAGLSDDPDDSDRVGVTALHYDHSHNVYTQHAGRKRFVLLPPHARKHLAPLRNMAGVMISEARAKHWGYVDKTPIDPPRLLTLKGGARFTMMAAKQDLAALPLDVFHNFGVDDARRGAATVDAAFLERHAIVADLGPGDVLYVPPFWYHEVTSYGGVSVSHNHWWNTAGWMDQIMKKLDNVASSQMPQTAKFAKPEGATGLQPAAALQATCGYANHWAVGAAKWPCQAVEPANPPHVNLQAELRTACARARGCAVADVKELLGDAPTWHQTFAEANPSYRQPFQENGLLKNRKKHL